MHTIDYRYLRPRKAAAMKRLHESNFECKYSPEIWSGKNATILPFRPADQYAWTGKGGVVNENGQYVPLSATYNFVNGQYDFENATYQDKKVVYCGYMVNHWGHFLVDAVNRLWYFLEADNSVDNYIFIVNENEERELKGNYKEFLVLLKIWDKIEFVNKPTTYREVIVPESGYQRGICYTPKYLSIFDTIAANAPIDPAWVPHQKIYLSRSMLPRAFEFEFGFDTSDHYFDKNGYTVMYPEKVPLAEMIFYIRNAQVVATVSGSTPHNIFFAQQGKKIEILERCAYIDDWQVYVNRMKELQVTYIDGHFSIYSVSMLGPFIMGYTDEMKQFTADKGYLPPDDEYLTERHYRKCFVQYMKSYQDYYRYRWFIEDYLYSEMDYHAEAYESSLTYFGEYLNGSKPFLWHHYFELHYWKQAVKRLLKR